ncbi:universal stress protein [Gemmatimonas groenlandica]|uniref:Universal stress protein n=1 Tax=Gemmatimonas groenlandica TaxID=2732249 RepID=A0A6M4ITX3_9BACT|nr:universal stress protein [Gemmatimonas groenlandica]QJR36936.1 universal stress protein [Gemmatimonas groenlandica]
MFVRAHDPVMHSEYLPPGTDGPVLVACDGASASSEALFNAGRLAIRALGGPLQVLGVCEPTPGVAAGMDVLLVPAELDEARRALMVEDVRRAISISAAGDPAWDVDVQLGSPARLLATEAFRRHASVIVMGIGRHNPLDRLFGTETTLATLRESRVPVLAVCPSFPTTPTHAVVGLDFSAASVQSARLAARLLAPNGRLTLVHVRPRFEHPSADWQAWDADYGRTLPPLFDQVRTQLDPPEGVTVDTVTVRGDPASSLLSFAQQAQCDLIAVGTQRHSFLERLMVGSVATRVLRTARCGVLAVPSAA